MRLVIQRVSRAKVSVDDRVIGRIDKGMVVLVGFFDGDGEEDVNFLADKLSKLRIMADSGGKMNVNIGDSKGSLLVVSQFTLSADTSKGNRPSFIKAANPKVAERLYGDFMARLKELGLTVETGKFGAYMMIDLELDGPVTIVLDSKR
ncbi:D-aminoacyl-tRNA deacylase [Patescibacteria group bacterium]